MSARKRGAGTAVASPGGSTGASRGAAGGRLMARPIVGGYVKRVPASAAARAPPGPTPGPYTCASMNGPYHLETLDDADRAQLEPWVSNLDSPVFALNGL